MGRCRFVQPDVVRLSLVDVHVRDLKTLRDKGVNVSGVWRAATDAEIADSEARVAVARDDGDWIDVKKELNAGEERGVFAKLVKEMHFDQKATLDPEQVGLSKIVAYIVAWSFRDASDKAVPFSESALKNLDSDTYAEISKAVDAHEETVVEARTARKNAKGSTIDSSST